MQLASSSGKTAPEPWLTVLPLCHFEGVVLFLLTTRTLAACLCPRKAMLRCTRLLSKEDESRIFLVVYTVCALACAGGLSLQVLGVGLSVSQGALGSADPTDSAEKS